MRSSRFIIMVIRSSMSDPWFKFKAVVRDNVVTIKLFVKVSHANYYEFSTQLLQLRLISYCRRHRRSRYTTSRTDTKYKTANTSPHYFAIFRHFRLYEAVLESANIADEKLRTVKLLVIVYYC